MNVEEPVGDFKKNKSQSRDLQNNACEAVSAIEKLIEKENKTHRKNKSNLDVNCLKPDVHNVDNSEVDIIRGKKNKNKNKNVFKELVVEPVREEVYVNNKKRVFGGGSIKNQYNDITAKIERYECVQEDTEFSFRDEKETVFSDVYNGKIVPPWMKNILVKNLEFTFNTLTKLYNPESFDRNDKKEKVNGVKVSKNKTRKNLVLNFNMRESFRQHKIVVESFRNKKPESKMLVQQYLWSIFENMDGDFTAAIANKKPPIDYFFCNLPEIYIDDFDSKHVNGHKEEDVIKISTIHNQLFELAEQTSRNVAFTAGSLKKRIKEFIAQGYEPILIEHYLVKHMPLLEPNQVFTKDKCKMWWKNFVPLHFYYLQTQNQQRFTALLAQRIANLRKRVIEYAIRYYKISKLPQYERIALFKKRKEYFLKLMQSARAQMLFASGHDKEFVSKVIYAECTNTINLEVDKMLRTRTDFNTVNNRNCYSDFFDEEEFEICVEDKASNTHTTKIKLHKIKRYLKAFEKPSISEYFDSAIVDHIDLRNSLFYGKGFLYKNLNKFEDKNKSALDRAKKIKFGSVHIEQDIQTTNKLHEQWYVKRCEYNTLHYVSDYPGFDVPKFYQFENFGAFLKARKQVDLTKLVKGQDISKNCYTKFLACNINGIKDESTRFVTESKNATFIKVDTEWTKAKPGDHFSWYFIRMIYGFVVGYACRKIFSGILLPAFNRLYQLYTWCVGCGNVANYVEAKREQFDELWVNLKSFELTNYDKIMLLEFKTCFHFVHALRNKNFSSAMAWLSNIAITRYNMIPSVVSMISRNRESIVAVFTLSSLYIFFDKYKMPIDAYKHMCKMYDNGEDIEEFRVLNSEEETFTTESGSASTVLRPIINLFVGDKIKNLNSFQVRDLNQQWQLSNHMTRNAENIIDSAQVFLQFLLRLLFGYDISDPAQQKFVYNMLVIMDKFKEHKFKHVEIKASKELMLETLCLYEEATLIKKNPRFQTVVSYISSFYDKLYFEYGNFAKEVSDLLRGSRLRNEPTCVLFTGPPKTGKSSTCNFLMQALSLKLYEKPYDATMTYVFNKQSEFWEGYNSNKFVLIDDLFSSNEPADRRLEANALIGMINTAPFNLPMAFESKGSMFFDSDFVFCSTNVANKGIKNCRLEIGMTDSTAVRRRFHWILHREEEFSGANVHSIEYRIDQAPEMYKHLVGTNISVKNFAQILWEWPNSDAPEVLSKEQFYAIFPEEMCRELRAGLNTPVRNEGLIRDEIVCESKEEEQQPEQSERTTEHVVAETLIESMQRVFSSGEDTPSSFMFAYYRVFLHTHETILFTTIDVAVKLFGFLVLLYGLVKLYGFFNSEPTIEPESHVKKYPNNSGKTFGNTNKMRTKKAVLRTFKRPREMKHKFKWNGVNLQSAELNFEKAAIKAAKGTMFLYCAALDNDMPIYRETCVGFHVKDGVIATVAHFILKFEEYDDVELYMKYDGKITQLDVSNIIIVEGQDLCFIKMPKNVNMPPSMYKYLVSENTKYNIYEGMNMMMVSSTNSGSPIFRSVTKISGPDECTYSLCGQQIIVYDPIAYSGITSPGDSGSMLFMPGLQGEPILVGMHLGYQESRAGSYRIALPLWKELYDEIVEQFVTESCQFPLEVLRTVEPSKAFHHPRKSKIVRSRLYGVFGAPEFVPTHLDLFKNANGEEINPAMNGLLKFKQVNFEAEIPDRVLDYLFNLYPRIDEVGLLSIDEIVNGKLGSGLISIKASTSPGYPYCLNNTKGKSGFVQFDGNKFVVTDAFVAEFNEKEALLRQGQQIEVIWADVLKDETRPVEKVEKGKTRIFSTCPLDYLFLVRKYFGIFVGEVQKHSVDKPVAVGINVHSSDWTRLYHRLASKGMSIIAGDFESYDTTLCKALGKFFVRFVNLWYDDGPINCRVRELLFEHVYNAVHIFGDKVYQLEMGNPSGNPLTAIYNSFCNIVATYIILIYDLKLRENDFEMTVYGDDNVIAIKKEGLRCSDLAPYYLQRFGLKYTHFSKDIVEPYDTLETIRYLGRRFVESNNVFRAPLELRVILEMVYWVRGKNAVLEKFLSTVEAFMIEMSHHTKNDFDLYQNSLIRAIQEKYPEAYNTVVKNRKTYWYYFEGMYDPSKYVKFMWFESNHKANSSYFDEFEEEIRSTSTHLVKSTMRLESLNVTSKEVKLFCSNKPVEYNVEQNDTEDRAENEALSTQEGRIGSFADVSVVEHTSATNDLMSVLQAPLNFEEYTLDQVLERTYEIASVNWVESMAIGATLVEIKFPVALFTQSFISQKLNGYKYFKARLRLSFRLASSKYLYGKLIASVEPNPSEGIHNFSVERLSGLPHVLLSASESSTVVMDVPFLNRKRAIDLTSYVHDELAHLWIRVLHPLHNTDGSTAKAVLTVYAQFIDAKVALPFSFVPESSKHEIREAEMKSKLRSISSAHENRVTNKLAVMRTRVGKKMSPFLEKASQVAETIANVAMVASLVGLDKPVTVDKTSSVSVVQDLDFMSGNGISHATKVGYDVDNSVSTAPICGTQGDEMSLINIVQTPMLSLNTAFVSGTLPTLLGIAGPQIDFSGPFKPTYVDWVSNQFGYVSGSVKYKIYITAGLFQSIRCVFYLAPDSTTATEWEGCYHKVVDIQGDTSVSFRVPYMNEYVMNSTRKPTTTPAIWCKILSWSTPNPTVSAPMYMAVYKAGCDDMKFGCPLEKVTYLQSSPRQDFAMDFEFLHEHMSGYTHEGIVMGEEVKSVRDVLHRLAPYYNISRNSIIEPWDGTGNATPAFHMGIEMWGELFKYYRGSIRIGFVGKKTTQVGMLTVRPTPETGYPTYYLPFAKSTDKETGIAQIEVPFYSDRPFYFTTETHPFQVQLACLDDGFLFKGVGDDFSFGFLVPPPTFPTVVPSTFGVQQLRSYYST